MMTLSARSLAALVLTAWMIAPVPPAAAQTNAPIFRFETDEFWLNLHHFLYVLGRAEAKAGDASREAVAGAPADAEKGLSAASISDSERQIHALIFFTAGQAVKRAVPTHVPYAEQFGLWNRGMKPLRTPLVEAWKPYLDGPSIGDSTARDAAILAILKKAPPTPPPTPPPPASPR